MDVVALNVVRRTAAYSCRLRLSEGGTLAGRSVVITTGVYLPAAWRACASRPAESFDISRRWIGVPRREGTGEDHSSRAGSLGGPSDQQVVAAGYRRPVLAPREGRL